MISMTLIPGPDRAGRDPADAKQLLAHRDYLVRIDPINYRQEPRSDPQGRISFPALIPGATYRIADRTQASGNGPQVRKEFTVKPGETLDLGDILIEKPPAVTDLVIDSSGISISSDGELLEDNPGSGRPASGQYPPRG